MENDDSIIQIPLSDNGLAMRLFGKSGDNIKRIESLTGIKADTRGSVVILQGPDKKVALAERLITQLYSLLEKGFPLTPQDINYAARILSSDQETELSVIFMDTVYTSYKNRSVSPKSVMQKLYLDSIKNYDMVFGIGPAGTGKTYLAIASAVAALSAKEVDRIILTRPAVEAGEKLGFLPGDLASKVDPYLRPLFDALNVMMDPEHVQRLMERGTIEVAPLAFMRGRTLDDSFVILDEAQNTTIEQMKMFLTRLGFGSKAVITGDITQIDLPLAKPSGLVASQNILKNIKRLRFIHFTEEDVVRHPLVQEVIKAFDKAERKKAVPLIEEI